MAYVIRLADGRVVTIVEHLNQGDRVFAPGETVEVADTADTQSVLPAGAPPPAPSSIP